MPNLEFLEKADARMPVSRRWDVSPVALVKTVRNSSAWQGWRMETVHARRPLAERSFQNGDSFILDFGEELVGKLKLTLRSKENYNDSPVRLRLIFAEFPLEIAERNRKYTGTLSRAWIQDEVITLDDMPQTYTLPRVYAMRYLFVEVMATPNRLVFEDIRFTARSAVRDFVPPLPEFSPEETELDRAAQRTAANGNQKNIDLIAMIHRKMAAIPFAPAPKRTLDTSPAAEKAPLPSEKERTRNFAPSIFSRRPLISKTIARSVNVSTEATPVTEIFPSPMVSTLGTAGFCMVYCMPPYKKNSA